MKRLLLATTMLSLGTTAAAYAATDLTILMLEGLDKGAMEAVAAQYTAGHPDVKITIQALPWSQFFQVSEMRMRAEDAEIDLI